MKKGDYPLISLSKRSNQYLSGGEYLVHHQYLPSGLRIIYQKSLKRIFSFQFQTNAARFCRGDDKGKQGDCFVKFQFIPPPLAPN